MEDQAKRPTYPVKAQALWLIIVLARPVFYVFMAVLFYVAMWYTPTFWASIFFVLIAVQVIASPFEYRNAVAHYEALRAVYGTLNDTFEEGVREPGEDTAYDRYK